MQASLATIGRLGFFVLMCFFMVAVCQTQPARHALRERALLHAWRPGGRNQRNKYDAQ
jgi:hypothetical protein